MRDPYQITFETWDTLAELYYEKFSAIRLYDTTYDSFCALIDKQYPEVLEIGCGPGNVTRCLIDRRADLHITGIDVAPNMIAFAKKAVPEAQFEVMDCRNLHAFKKRFDAIFIGFCLPYLSKDDLTKLLRGCAALIAERGILYLSVIEGDYAKSGMETGSKPEYRMQVFYYPEEQIQHLISEAGFTSISVDRIAYPSQEDARQVHLIFFARKN